MRNVGAFSVASIKVIQRMGRSCIFAAKGPLNVLRGLFIMTSNVNNRRTKSCTSGYAIRIVVGRVTGDRNRSVRHILMGTVGTTGHRVVGRTSNSRRLGKVKAAIITTAIGRRVLCFTGIKSDHLCLVGRKVRRLDGSRSLMRRVMHLNKVGPRRTGRRPSGGVVAETVKTGTSISISFCRRHLGQKSVVLVYASKLDGVIRSRRLFRVIRKDQSVIRTNRVLIRTTGRGKKASGVKIMLFRPFTSRIDM